MGSLKWVAVVICGLGAMTAIALGVLGGGAREDGPRAILAPVGVRPLPPMVEGSASGQPAGSALAAQEPDAAKPLAPAKLAPAGKPGEAAPAGSSEGTLNLRASDTADVYVDGSKVGGSPVLGFKVKTGTRRVRFDCYDAAGNAIAGPVKVVTVKADQEQDVTHECPDVY